ncbi:Lrp/AsnC family transcriptional regulator [Acidocella sp. KAb 2-4]|uniref:Lrp/AsnC family transcriptional regulator n=1 Tax=Acidocella sp. KAb 2-4 TaxID=2885158 RepID=UPI001D05FCF7|nr:Lrp/AsnC family transcriptional regulator [Acidocella sp. KAb 2-4]MCB5944318.1 Lrp/AsnC family transcriptional regulator [Acidocella sp. KAb 2-4]
MLDLKKYLSYAQKIGKQAAIHKAGWGKTFLSVDHMKLRKGRRITNAGIDAIDKGIIDILTVNGRANNQEIAARLSVTPATVSSRLNRMEEQRIMKVVAVTDFAAHGYNVIIAIGVSVKGRPVLEVAQDLAALPEVFSVNVMHGRYDLEMLVVLHDFEEVRVFLDNHVRPIEGIDEMDPGIAVDIKKFEFNIAPL